MVRIRDHRGQRSNAWSGAEIFREVLSILAKPARPCFPNIRRADAVLLPLARLVTFRWGDLVSICCVATLAPHAGRREAGVWLRIGSA